MTSYCALYGPDRLVGFDEAEIGQTREQKAQRLQAVLYPKGIPPGKAD